MKQMHIIKRSGEERDFDISKIRNAIRKASQVVDIKDALSEEIGRASCRERV